jgi:hypothetical protein
VTCLRDKQTVVNRYTRCILGYFGSEDFQVQFNDWITKLPNPGHQVIYSVSTMTISDTSDFDSSAGIIFTSAKPFLGPERPLPFRQEPLSIFGLPQTL